MAVGHRTFVAFDDLWHMAIDVPYSLLVTTGNQAWSCGQLALDRDARVLAPGDLTEQSRIVIDYLREIIARATLGEDHLKRLTLYYIDVEGGRDSMLDTFRQAFGSDIILDPIPVPHFYYDGVMLEVDVFAGGARPSDGHGNQQQGGSGSVCLCEDDALVWVSIEMPADAIHTAVAQLESELSARGLGWRHLLSGHWLAPQDQMFIMQELSTEQLQSDKGATISIGDAGRTCCGRFTFAKNAPSEAGLRKTRDQGVQLISTRAGEFGWIHARCHDEQLGLIDQTRSVMRAIEKELLRHGEHFSSVVKSTTHYVGGSSAAELHENMGVRNSYYCKPGPASTGVPVFGFGDRASRIVVDVTYVTVAA